MTVPSSSGSHNNIATPGTKPNSKRRGRGASIALGVVLVGVVIAAVVLGRGGETNDGRENGGSARAGLTSVHGVIGSEKRGFFEDPEVADRFAELGYEVSVSTAGSRKIATGVDVAAQDFVSPSSAPASQKVLEQVSGASVEYPFFSPMAVASWHTIADILLKEGVVREEGGAYVLDVGAYVDLARSGARWRDLSEAFPSPRSVQIRSTDIRTSNSAAMYLSLLAWEFAERDSARADDAGYLIGEISPFFTGQGYSESTSSGPFDEYLAQGMGAAPLVMVYEAQFIGEQLRPNSRIRNDMVLLQLSPTVLANHGIVGVTEEGKDIGRLLTHDEKLQKLAARHGFRPATAGSLAEEMEARGLAPPADYINSVDPPHYDRLEKLIDGIGTRYGVIAPPPAEEETEQ